MNNIKTIDHTTEFVYTIHKKYGCIKKIPKHAAGWMNRIEWEVRETFPNEKQYFLILEDKLMQKIKLQKNISIQNNRHVRSNVCSPVPKTTLIQRLKSKLLNTSPPDRFEPSETYFTITHITELSFPDRLRVLCGAVIITRHWIEADNYKSYGTKTWVERKPEGDKNGKSNTNRKD